MFIVDYFKCQFQREKRNDTIQIRNDTRKSHLYTYNNFIYLNNYLANRIILVPSFNSYESFQIEKKKKIIGVLETRSMSY